MIEDDTFPIIVRRNTIVPQYSIRVIAVAARGTGQIRCLKRKTSFATFPVTTNLAFVLNSIAV
jgi:hypothetical protein